MIEKEDTTKLYEKIIKEETKKKRKKERKRNEITSITCRSFCFLFAL